MEITSPNVIRRPITESFRAPDTLCPATAGLAAGMAIEENRYSVGPTSSLAAVAVAEPEIEHGKISCEVIDFNRFGNVQLNVRQVDLVAGLDDLSALTARACVGGTEARRGALTRTSRPANTA